jgi:hypothetical protein
VPGCPDTRNFTSRSGQATRADTRSHDPGTSSSDSTPQATTHCHGSFIETLVVRQEERTAESALHVDDGEPKFREEAVGDLQNNLRRRRADAIMPMLTSLQVPEKRAGSSEKAPGEPSLPAVRGPRGARRGPTSPHKRYPLRRSFANFMQRGRDRFSSKLGVIQSRCSRGDCPQPRPANARAGAPVSLARLPRCCMCL